MTEVSYGLTLSSEEHPPRRLVELAVAAEQAGFDFVSISDHYHPWVRAQGHSPFVWSVLGAISASTERLHVGVGVTCPIIRIHPAIVAQAAATTACLLPGRFTFGVGTGEALNESILGDRWPPHDVRLEMLDEAIEVMRRLWTEESVTHRGRYYTVENATVHDKPEDPFPLVISAFGPNAVQLAAERGDGLWVTGPGGETVEQWKQAGGSGPVWSQLNVCVAADEDSAAELVAEVWPNTGVPGQLSQDLPTSLHFEQAAQRVTPELVKESMPCGPDPAPIVEGIRAAVDGGVDHVYVHQVGDDQERFLDLWQREIAPALGR